MFPPFSIKRLYFDYTIYVLSSLMFSLWKLNRQLGEYNDFLSGEPEPVYENQSSITRALQIKR